MNNKTYIDYLFEDENTGEMFFVEIIKDVNKSWTDCYHEALCIALAYFENPVFIQAMSAALAETYGYDTY